MNNSVALLKQNNIFKNKKVFSQIVKNEYVIRHTHNFIEFFYVINGRCSQKILDKEIEITKNNAFILFPGDVHELINDNQYFLHRDILINTAYFKTICDSYSPNLYNDLRSHKILCFTLDNNDINQIENSTKALLVSKQRAIYEYLIVSYIINLLLLHQETFEKEENKEPAWVNHLKYMLSTPSNFKTKLGDILSSFNYTHEHMSKVFKKYSGKTPIDYFIEKKIEEASRQLIESNKTIKEIAESTGFINTEHFYHVFKKYMKKTPKQYRESINK